MNTRNNENVDDFKLSDLNFKSFRYLYNVNNLPENRNEFLKSAVLSKFSKLLLSVNSTTSTFINKQFPLTRPFVRNYRCKYCSRPYELDNKTELYIKPHKKHKRNGKTYTKQMIFRCNICCQDSVLQECAVLKHLKRRYKKTKPKNIPDTRPKSPFARALDKTSLPNIDSNTFTQDLFKKKKHKKPERNFKSKGKHNK